MRKPVIAANWKLNGDLALCREFASTFDDLGAGAAPEVLVCPPAVYIPAFVRLLEKSVSVESGEVQTLKVGAQNVAREAAGAFTGEISASMLAEVGVQYCIVGHSERRAIFGETDDEVLAKSQLLADSGITAIVCIGESLSVREAGKAETFVAGQLNAVLSRWSGISAESIVLAYEPVWAIGTGVSATTEQVQAMHSQIRQQADKFLDADALRILYGGSVKASNAAELLALDDVDGALVGGASLNVDEFRQIVAAAN